MRLAPALNSKAERLPTLSNPSRANDVNEQEGSSLAGSRCRFMFTYRTSACDLAVIVSSVLKGRIESFSSSNSSFTNNFSNVEQPAVIAFYPSDTSAPVLASQTLCTSRLLPNVSSVYREQEVSDIIAITNRSADLNFAERGAYQLLRQSQGANACSQSCPLVESSFQGYQRQPHHMVDIIFGIVRDFGIVWDAKTAGQASIQLLEHNLFAMRTTHQRMVVRQLERNQRCQRPP